MSGPTSLCHSQVWGCTHPRPPQTTPPSHISSHTAVSVGPDSSAARAAATWSHLLVSHGEMKVFLHLSCKKRKTNKNPHKTTYAIVLQDTHFPPPFPPVPRSAQPAASLGRSLRYCVVLSKHWLAETWAPLLNIHERGRWGKRPRAGPANSPARAAAVGEGEMLREKQGKWGRVAGRTQCQRVRASSLGRGWGKPRLIQKAPMG